MRLRITRIAFLYHNVTDIVRARNFFPPDNGPAIVRFIQRIVVVTPRHRPRI